LAEPAALLDVKREITLQDEISPAVAKFLSSSVNCAWWPLKFDERSDGRLIEFDEQALCPGRRDGQSKCRAVLFIAKPPAHPKPFEDFCEDGRIGYFDLNFFAHFVAVVLLRARGRGRSYDDGPFEGQQSALRGGCFALFRFGFRCFYSNPEQLTVLGKTTFGRVENDVPFVYATCATTQGPGAQPLQRAHQSLYIADSQLDFDFLRHLDPCRRAARLSPAPDFR
jgi:hypothetical protein